jgi:hypothetical protein
VYFGQFFCLCVSRFLASKISLYSQSTHRLAIRADLGQLPSRDQRNGPLYSLKLQRYTEPAWFPWADSKSDGTLVVAWDQDTGPAPADTFNHVLKVGANPATSLGPTENPDVSVTHWAGQYVPQSHWPAICGPVGYSDPPIANAEGKDCNIFHGDYTGLAVGPDDSINVAWTGLNESVTSPQVDFYTGALHDGYRQDAMFARR